MLKLLMPALLAGLSCNAFAQQGEQDPDGAGGPPRWGIGVGAAVTDSPYAGEGARIVPIPLVTYQGERFFFRGLTAGWTLAASDAFELSALAKLRLDGFDVDDLGTSELAANGIDARLLEDRDAALDLGLGGKWTGAGGELEFELLTDVSDQSGGQEMSLQYGFPIQAGNGRLTPAVGATWLSKDNANYYYGTLDEEVARGVVDYKPGSVTVPHVAVSYVRPIGPRWLMLGTLKYSLLPDEITDSPLIERDTDAAATMFIGFARGF